jgi:hypothetical protein
VHPRAATLIEQLRMERHPEGGYFREIFRSGRNVQPDDERPARAAMTTIYFLLAAGQQSRWHSVRSDEIWHFYEGDPLELSVSPPLRERVDRLTLSPLSETGRPVHVVPARWWQSARPLGEYTLVGCTVAPGFDFADFSFLPDDKE